MKICKNCGILIGSSLEVKYRQVLLCKICHAKEQRDSFNFWYNKQPKKIIEKKDCLICGKEFTPKTRAKYCSDVCREKAIKLRRRIRRKKLALNK